MSPRRLLFVVAVVAVVAALATVLSHVHGSSGSSSRTTALPSAGPLASARPLPSGAPSCRFPRRVAAPDWYPSDLPLPAGSYTSQLLSETAGYSRAVFVVPGSLPDLVKFVLREWPHRGWILGRGDAEANEAEDTFEKAPAAGAFKAQGQFCFPGYALVLLVYTPARADAGLAGTQPGSPIPPAPAPSRSG